MTLRTRRDFRQYFKAMGVENDPIFDARPKIWSISLGRKIRAVKPQGHKTWTLTWEKAAGHPGAVNGEKVAGSDNLTSEVAVTTFLRSLQNA